MARAASRRRWSRRWLCARPTARASGGRIADTPNERLVDVLREALDIAEGQDDYLLDNCTPASEAAEALGEATATAPWAELHASGKTMFRFSNAWTTDLVEAKTLAMFAYMLRARVG